MAERYALPTGSLNKVMRWYNARKAAGHVIQPWELEAAYRAELEALGKTAYQNRSLSESKRQFDAQMAFNREQMEGAETAGKYQLAGQLGTAAVLRPDAVKSGYSALKKSFSSGLNTLRDAKAIPQMTAAGIPSETSYALPAASSAGLTASKAASMGLPFESSFVSPVAASSTPAAAGTSLAGISAASEAPAAGSTVGSGAGSFLSPAALGGAAAAIGGGIISKNAHGLAERLPGGEQEWSSIGSTISGAGAGFGIGSLVAGGAAAGGPIGAAIGAGIGLLTSLFCFANGTMIEMEDGSEKPVEELDLGNITKEGGAVVGIGRIIGSNIHEYFENRVEGGHAAFENGKWIRIQDSDKSELLDIERMVLYPVVTENHLLVIGGRVYADLSETDVGWGVSEEESLALLNAMDERNKYLSEKYDN